MREEVEELMEALVEEVEEECRKFYLRLKIGFLDFLFL